MPTHYDSPVFGSEQLHPFVPPNDEAGVFHDDNLHLQTLIGREDLPVPHPDVLGGPCPNDMSLGSVHDLNFDLNCTDIVRPKLVAGYPQHQDAVPLESQMMLHNDSMRGELVLAASVEGYMSERDDNLLAMPPASFKGLYVHHQKRVSSGASILDLICRINRK
eukprot:Selendium_serpulae@DN9205_c0_g1_i1.p1